MKLLLSILVATLVSGCASAPKSRDWNWVLIWNQAQTVAEMERAAALMERHNYIRYSEQIVRNYVNPNLGSTPVADLEHEMVYFRLASDFLYHWQADGQGMEKARVYARRLSELPNLHPMSKFLIARVQELDGGSYNAHYVPVPPGARMWFFAVGTPANTPNEISFGSFEAEYQKILSEKHGGAFGRATQIACAAVLICLTGVNSDEELVINDLRRNVYLWVEDAHRQPIKIGASSWTEVAQSH